MKQLLSSGLVALGLTLALTGQVRAEFTLVTDSAALNENDTASWTSFNSGHLGFANPMTSEVYGESIGWGVNVHSDPYYNSLVNFHNGPNTLFIGTANTSGQVDTAYFDFNMYFSSPPNLPVYGVGFPDLAFGVEGTGFVQVTAYDVNGNSQTFDLGNYSFSNGGFLGVLSDEPLARLEIVSSHTGTIAFSTLDSYDGLELAIAPAPPSWVLFGLGTLTLLGYGWRRRKLAAT